MPSQRRKNETFGRKQRATVIGLSLAVIGVGLEVESRVTPHLVREVVRLVLFSKPQPDFFDELALFESDLSVGGQRVTRRGVIGREDTFGFVPHGPDAGSHPRR